MKRARAIIGWIWLITGTAIGLSCLADIYTVLGQHNRGETNAALIFLGFSCVAAFGGYRTLRHKRWAFPTLCVSSLFGLVYGSLYWLFGGIEDTGWIYAAAVGALILLSAATPIVWLVTLASVQQEVQRDA